MRESGDIFWKSIPHKSEDVGAFWAPSFLGGQFTSPGFGSLLLREGVDFLQLSVQTAQLKWMSSSQGCPRTLESLPKGGPPQWSFQGSGRTTGRAPVACLWLILCLEAQGIHGMRFNHNHTKTHTLPSPASAPRRVSASSFAQTGRSKVSEARWGSALGSSYIWVKAGKGVWSVGLSRPCLALVPSLDHHHS